MRFFTSILLWGALSTTGFLALTAGTQAQTLNGIRVGEEISAASRIAGKPTSRAAAGPHEEVRWRLPDGTSSRSPRVASPMPRSMGRPARWEAGRLPWLHLW
jgi:hypothetical protein